jgi:Subunit ChlI of Mg-chelatase
LFTDLWITSGAARNSTCIFPERRITVNLAPADLMKEGPFRQTGKLTRPDRDLQAV